MTKQITRELTERQLKTIELRSSCKSWPEAARQAGYSEPSAENIVSLFRRSKAVCDRIREDAVLNALFLEPKLAAIDEAVVDIVVKDPRLAPAYDKPLTRIHKKAGLLNEIVQIAKTTINFANIQVLMQHLNKTPADNLKSEGVDCVDAELLKG